uniref:VLTF3-like protein n=1 Tax=Marseillevirus LCMAC201 TaxID=2506605 RepID=A0A481YV60_9VIRU|nr:MAG: VLTF3-like protein [Marseillevirus LCMAC201]
MDTFVYKEQNHHRSEIRGQNQNVPKEVIEEVRQRVGSNPSCEDIKFALKCLNMSSYLPKIPSIYFELTGEEPPNLPKEIEDELVDRWEEEFDLNVRRVIYGKRKKGKTDKLIEIIRKLRKKDPSIAREFIPQDI